MIATSLLLTIVFTALVTEIMQRKGLMQPGMARKYLHIVAIGISAFAVFYVDVPLLLLITGCTLPVLFLLVFFGFFRDPQTNRKSWGILYFAISYFILLLIFGTRNSSVVYYAMIVLALSDGLAAMVGMNLGKIKIDFSPEAKTLEGSLVFFFTTFICLYFGDGLALGEVISFTWISALSLSVFLSLLEALSLKGRDNLWVPLAIAYFLEINPDWFHPAVIASLIFLPLLGILAIKLKWLTQGGATAACLLGWIFLWNDRPEWVIPAVVFFVLGSFFSKLPGRRQIKSEDIRNADQVFANGGVPALFLGFYFFTGNQGFLIGFLSGFAFALSDTASSELGSRFKSGAYRILSLDRVSAGVSGGITIFGSFMGILFSGIIGLAAFLIDSSLGLSAILIVILSGFAGNIFDSIIGDKFQIKYRLKSGQWSDYKSPIEPVSSSGIAWISNSRTNLISSLLSCILGCLLS